MKFKLILLFATLFSVQAAIAQRTITGSVTDADTGDPLVGASVVAVGTTTGTLTEADGSFSIPVGDAVTSLRVSYASYEAFEVSIEGTNTVAVRLSSALSLDEIVVVGYATERKKDLKGAVSVVKIDEALNETNANVLSSLQGRVPGLNVATDGAPGTGANISLRGLASFNNNTPPLFVVDGVPTFDINGLSQNDIESFQVLRDAASAAIYGARASGGVIIITTKKGKVGKPIFTADVFWGSRTIRNKPEMLNAQQYGEVLWQAFANDGIAPSDPIYGDGATPVIPSFIDGGMTTPAGDTDWISESFQPANTYAVNLGVSQAVDQSNYYFGINYNKEDGILVNTFYERLTGRINTSFKVGNRLTVGENLSIALLRGNRENEARALEAAFVQHPLVPLMDNLGNWAGPFASLGDFRNAVGDLDRFKDNINNDVRMFGNVFAELDIVKGLKFRSSFGVDHTDSGRDFFENRYVMGRFSSDANRLIRTEGRRSNFTATNTLAYALNTGDHSFNVVAGYEWLYNTYEFTSITATDFFIENEDYIQLSAGTIQNASGSGNEYGLVSQFGQVNYTFGDRYLASVSVRRDGSSRFGANNRYGIFPGVSAAWRISAEEFFGSAAISELKIRASWGQNGNDNIRDYNYATFFGPSIDYANYDITGSNQGNSTGFIVSSIGNPDTKWEALTQTNIGIDLEAFDGKLAVSLDLYNKDSRDLLYQVQLPATVGEGIRPFINVGNINNRGIEMLASYRDATSGGFRYNFDFTLASNKSKVLSVGVDGEDVQFPGPHIIQKDLELAEFYGFINDGIFQNQGEVDAHAAQDGKAVGMLRYRDINEDGVINEDDRTNIGSPHPDLVLGLNSGISYKSFDLNLFIDSKLGHQVWDASKTQLDFLGFISNHSTNLLDAWSPENPDSEIPILTDINANFNKQASSYFLENGSFVRLRSISLGYTLPASLLNSLDMSNFRIYVQGQNLLTLTGYDGYDFETLDGDLGSLGVSPLTQYPHVKGVTVGLNVKF